MYSYQGLLADHTDIAHARGAMPWPHAIIELLLHPAQAATRAGWLCREEVSSSSSSSSLRQRAATASHGTALYRCIAHGRCSNYRCEHQAESIDRLHPHRPACAYMIPFVPRLIRQLSASKHTRRSQKAPAASAEAPRLGLYRHTVVSPASCLRVSTRIATTAMAPVGPGRLSYPNYP
jgi:hypothetical protein